MDKEVFSDKIEKIIVKINSLNYRFESSHIQGEADLLIQSAVESLENYLDLVEDDDFEQTEDE